MIQIIVNPTAGGGSAVDHASTLARACADAGGGGKLKPKAKHVILCYMAGGVSQVDSFDPKP